MKKPTNHDALEIQMQHDLRDALARYELMNLNLRELEVGVRNIEQDIREIKEQALVKVQKNSDAILQLKTVGGVMSALFSVILGIIGMFKILGIIGMFKR
jgi:hypothetical protein